MAGNGSRPGPCTCPEPTRGTLPDEFLTHVQKGNLDEIELWLSNGSDVNAATEGGQTLLSAACVYQNLEVVQRLLKDPQLHLNTKHRIGTLSRFTPLCIAANKGLCDIVSALVGWKTGECRLDVGITTSKGKSAITLAAERNYWDVVETLCQDLSIPHEDTSIVTSLARWAKKAKIAELLQRHQATGTHRVDNSSTPAAERIYENNTSHGLVLMLNYKFENNPVYHRKGAEVDASRLRRVFQGMDYETEEHCDLSQSETLDCLDEFSRRDRLKDISCIIVVVLTHGMNRDTFLTADDKFITMDTLCRYFTDSSCPNMRGKPKIFLLQFCRGPNMAEQVNDSFPHSDKVMDAFTDMMCLYAAQEGFKSYRYEGRPNDPFTGTPFIKAFCQVLEGKSHLWLDDLLREFIDEYSNTEYGQPLDYHNLTFKKKFCFNPSR